MFTKDAPEQKGCATLHVSRASPGRGATCLLPVPQKPQTRKGPNSKSPTNIRRANRRSKPSHAHYHFRHSLFFFSSPIMTRAQQTISLGLLVSSVRMPPPFFSERLRFRIANKLSLLTENRSTLLCSSSSFLSLLSSRRKSSQWCVLTQNQSSSHLRIDQLNHIPTYLPTYACDPEPRLTLCDPFYSSHFGLSFLSALCSSSVSAGASLRSTMFPWHTRS